MRRSPRSDRSALQSCGVVALGGSAARRLGGTVVAPPVLMATSNWTAPQPTYQAPRYIEPQPAPGGATPHGVIRPNLIDDKPEVPTKKLSWFMWMMIGFGALILIGIVVSFARTANAPMPTIDTSGQDAPEAPVQGSPAPAAR